MRSASFFLQLRLFELQRKRFHVELGNHVTRRQKLAFDHWQVLDLAPHLKGQINSLTPVDLTKKCPRHPMILIRHRHQLDRPRQVLRKKRQREHAGQTGRREKNGKESEHRMLRLRLGKASKHEID